jgi:hypothetical protein
MFTDAETLARSDQVGTLIHRAIADLAATNLEPNARVIMLAADRSMPMFAKIEARAHRQNVAGGVLAYFRYLLPPHGWQFAGSEIHLGVGRVDLIWTHPDGGVLVDEIKTGGWLGRAAIAAQVAAYLDCARAAWPDQFIGLRLVSTRDPTTSLFFTPTGQSSPLRNTPYLRSH